MKRRRKMQAFTLIQLVIAVVAIAVVMRVALEFGESRQDHRPQLTQANLGNHGYSKNHQGKVPRPAVEEPDPIVALVPGTKPGETGATSAIGRLLRQYRPLITDEKINELVDTLPPGGDQRIIVILPTAQPAPPADHPKCDW